MKRTRLRSVSDRRLDGATERTRLREHVLERDKGCVFHRILPGPCAGPTDVHEVLTRARGGSHLDPDNCVALCNWANTVWIAQHPAGAEVLGLLLPSWTNVGHHEEAWRSRAAHQRIPGLPFKIPSWREGDADFEVRAMRDLMDKGRWA